MHISVIYFRIIINYQILFYFFLNCFNSEKKIHKSYMLYKLKILITFIKYLFSTIIT